MDKPIQSFSTREQINFLLANRIPRRLFTQFFGWYSKIKSPRLTRLSIAIWSFFAEDLRLQDAKKTRFSSLQDCFIRELKPGLRPVDQRDDVVTSPCDAIVGMCGQLDDATLLQAKGFPYKISELILDDQVAKKYSNGIFITLRLKSSMYHRFHAPVDCTVKKVNYISGDTWNVNPIALKKIEKLFCKNERAIIELDTPDNCHNITLVPVAAILVACMKFRFLPMNLDLKYLGPNHIDCYAEFNKGEEMGHFQHGSTIILFAEQGYQLADQIETGKRINMGEAILTGHNKTISLKC